MQPRHVSSLAALAIAAAALSGTARAATSDEAAVLAVLHRFDAAIRDHDAPALKGLFYKGEIVWKLTLTPAQVDRYKKTNKDLEAVTSIFGGYRLLDDERMRRIPIAERFYDPQVISDGQMASLTFDYDFTMNCKPRNWGKETWQLVKTGAGWKILNLLYSGYEPVDGPFPARHALPVAGCTPVPPATQNH